MSCLTQYVWPYYNNPLARQQRLWLFFKYSDLKRKKKEIALKSVHGSCGTIKDKQLTHLFKVSEKWT